MWRSLKSTVPWCVLYFSYFRKKLSIAFYPVVFACDFFHFSKKNLSFEDVKKNYKIGRKKTIPTQWNTPYFLLFSPFFSFVICQMESMAAAAPNKPLPERNLHFGFFLFLVCAHSHTHTISKIKGKSDIQGR